MRHHMLLLLVLVSFTAFGQELPAGAPFEGTAVVTAPTRTAFRDLGGPVSMCVAGSASSRLLDMTAAQRDNAILGLLVDAHADVAVQAAARSIEQQWNAGDQSGAIAALAGMESALPASAISYSIAWRSPVPSVIQGTSGTDVRVGSRDSLMAVSMDRDPVNGNLMAVLHVVKYNQEIWTINLSTDGGTTWSETYSWNALYAINSISFTILRGYGYIAFTRGAQQDQILVYRFSTSTGSTASWPNGNPYLTTATTTLPEKFVNVSAASNNAFSALRNRLYVTTISSAHKVRFFYYAVDSTTASEVATGITSAARGLSTCYNQPGTFMWISYVDTLGHVCIDSVNSAVPSYGRVYRYANAYQCSNTSISAHLDTIFCAFDYISSFTQTQYLIRYGSASIWRFGAFADSSLGSETPAATLAGDAGIAMVDRNYTAQRSIRIAHRAYAFGSTWSGATVVSDHDAYFKQPAIVHMGGKKYGVLYLSWNAPVTRGAYFDTYDAAPTGVEEGSVMPDKFVLDQNYPNPFNPSTTIGYTLPEQAQVTLTVFDALGRAVAELVNGEQVAGAHQVRFDGSKLSSGVYYYRLQAGTWSATRKLLLVK